MRPGCLVRQGHAGGPGHSPRQTHASWCCSTQLDSFKGVAPRPFKIYLSKLARKTAVLRYKGLRAGFCRRPYRRPRSAPAGLEAPIRRVFMGRAARAWLKRHGWELVLIVAAAVVSDIVDHLW